MRLTGGPQRDRPGATAWIGIGLLAAVLTGRGPATTADEVPVANRELGAGKRVLLRSAAATLRVGREAIPTRGIHHVYRTGRTEGEWVWISAGRIAGWARRADILSLDQALDYFYSRRNSLASAAGPCRLSPRP